MECSRKKIRLKVLTKSDENYTCIEMGYAKALDMFRFFHQLSLDAISKTLSEKQRLILKKFKFERREGIITYERFDSMYRLNNIELPSK